MIVMMIFFCLDSELPKLLFYTSLLYMDKDQRIEDIMYRVKGIK